MAIQTEVVYPSTSSFSGTSQLDLGPYHLGLVKTLLRAEVHGQVNFQGAVISSSSVTANFQLWAVQYVPAGNPANNIVTTADGPAFLIRQQVGSEDMLSTWAPNTSNAAVIGALALEGEWAGQQPINASIDLWMSLKAPTGASIPNQNLFASLRFWWS